AGRGAVAGDAAGRLFAGGLLRRPVHAGDAAADRARGPPAARRAAAGGAAGAAGPVPEPVLPPPPGNPADVLHRPGRGAAVDRARRRRPRGVGPGQAALAAPPEALTSEPDARARDLSRPLLARRARIAGGGVRQCFAVMSATSGSGSNSSTRPGRSSSAATPAAATSRPAP